MFLTLGVSEESVVSSDAASVVVSTVASVTSFTLATARVKRSTLWFTCSWIAEPFATNASASAIAAATSVLTEASWPSKLLALACPKATSNLVLSTKGDEGAVSASVETTVATSAIFFSTDAVTAGAS